MKLIRSVLSNTVSCLTESVGGQKQYYIEGIFMQAEQPNRNKRIYPKKVLEEAVDKYITEQVKTKRSVGELGHPEGPTVNLDRVSHLITSLKWEKNDVIGKALIVETPMGDIVKGLLKSGVQLGVSSRGMGDVDEGRNGISTVCEGYLVNTVDVVQDPSATGAFVNGIMEGVEYFFDKRKNAFIAEKVDRLQKKFSRMSKSQILECQSREFEAFVKSL